MCHRSTYHEMLNITQPTSKTVAMRTTRIFTVSQSVVIKHDLRMLTFDADSFGAVRLLTRHNQIKPLILYGLAMRQLGMRRSAAVVSRRFRVPGRWRSHSERCQRLQCVHVPAACSTFRSLTSTLSHQTLPRSLVCHNSREIEVPRRLTVSDVVGEWWLLPLPGTFGNFDQAAVRRFGDAQKR